MERVALTAQVREKAARVWRGGSGVRTGAGGPVAMASPCHFDGEQGLTKISYRGWRACPDHSARRAKDAGEHGTHQGSFSGPRACADPSRLMKWP